MLCDSIATEPNALVPANPVAVTICSVVKLTVPKEPVALTPVALTLAAATTVAVPTAVVAETPVAFTVAGIFSPQRPDPHVERPHPTASKLS